MRSFRLLWALFDPAGRWRLVGLLALMLAAALIEAFAVASLLPFLSGVVSASGNGVALQGTVAAGGAADSTWLLAVVFSLAVVASVGLRAAADYASMAFSSMQCARWSRRLLLVQLNRDYDWFAGQHSANLGYGLLERVQEVVNTSLLPALRVVVNALAALAICAVLLRAMPLLMLLVAGGLVLAYAGVFWLMRRRFHALSEERERVAALRHRLTSDVLAGIKDVKLHGLEAGYDARIRVPFERHAELYSLRYLFSILPRYVLEALGFVTVCVVVLVLGGGAGGLQAALPTLGLFGFAAFRLLPSVQQVYQNAASLPMGYAGLTALHGDLAAGDDKVPSDRAPLPMDRQLSLVDATYRYPGASRVAIDVPELHIAAGSMVALVGPSGAGKSTLADVLMALLTPATGALCVDGVPLDRDTRRAWQAACSHVAQHVFLLDDSIAANIAFGLPAETRDMARVIEAAKAAALHEFISTGLPQGYDTPVGERGARLSGGQRQRLGIARALYRKSACIVLDEATNALDAGTESEVLAALDGIRGRRTIVIIAHRMATVAHCDRVLLIDGGKVAADGRYNQLLRDSAAFRAFANAAGAGGGLR